MLKIIIKKAQNHIEQHIELVSKIKNELKKNKFALEIIKDNNFDTNIIDAISISFNDKLEASAKTTDGKIEVNSNLIEKGFEIIMRYVIHELVHVFQHMKDSNSDESEYLDNPDELEAFQYQVAYEADELGEESAINYVDELMEFHEIPDDEKTSKKEELLKLV